MSCESGEAKYAVVAVEAPLASLYHYRIPENMSGEIKIGSPLVVPFGPRKITGFCVDFDAAAPLAESRIKDVAELPGIDVIPQDILNLSKWMAKYYCSSWGMSLAAAVPAPIRKGKKEKTVLFARLTVGVDEARKAAFDMRKRAPLQSAVLEKLLELGEADGEAAVVSVPELEIMCNASRASIKGLAAKDLIAIEDLVPGADSAEAAAPISIPDIKLTEDQQSAVCAINEAVNSKEFASFLLYGVTGSGKTEVYLQAMQEALACGRGVLVLVPEISLTPQTVARFRSRAGKVAVLHSNMSDGERAEDWRRLRRGDVRVVVGARSALFAPIPDLGLIIIDEEHERTFKQDNDPRYNARDLAVLRARENNATIVLGTATPSLETWQNVCDKKYRLLRLPERVGGAHRPVARVVDMREEWREQKKMAVFSRDLERELRACMHRQEQAIIFLNRRGFNTIIRCMECGEALQCPDCDIAMTFHRGDGILKCHYCDHTCSRPEKCPTCGKAALKFAGTGTERVEDLVARFLPEARVLRMDSDTMTRRDAYEDALSAFASGEFDILLGTQMIAKGLDFPNVTLVGVLLADAAINMPDFRSAERAFQLVTQVVGRAGRAKKPGVAIIQAIQPEHYAIAHAVNQDFNSFVERELKTRKILRYPPFGKIARIIIRGPVKEEVEGAGHLIAERMRNSAPRPGMVLGASPCPVAKIQSQYRYHILLKSADHSEIVAGLNSAMPLPGGKLQIAFDVDPVSML